ncbi:hypothetical protein [Deinococcus yunweiensis]|uniref:hypothetical protein n=1 Tax=Deinococcus yunweiensis TaxID=367282 RepID=UPI00398F4578
MTISFDQELQAIRRLDRGLASARKGEYQTQPHTVDPVLARIDEICQVVAHELPRRLNGASVLNAKNRGTEEQRGAKVALADSIDVLVGTLSLPARLMGDLIRLYDEDFGKVIEVSESERTRGSLSALLAAAALTGGLHDQGASPGQPPLAQSVQQAPSLAPSRPLMVPADSPVGEHLRRWEALYMALQEEYEGLDDVAFSQAVLLDPAHAAAVDEILDDNSPWDDVAVEESLTFNDLRTGEVQVLRLHTAALDGSDWVVTFEPSGDPVPLLGRGEVVRVVTRDGGFVGDLHHADLLLSDGELRVEGVADADRTLLATLDVKDISQVALLHYGRHTG